MHKWVCVWFTFKLDIGNKQGFFLIELQIIYKTEIIGFWLYQSSLFRNSLLIKHMWLTGSQLLTGSSYSIETEQMLHSFALLVRDHLSQVFMTLLKELSCHSWALDFQCFFLLITFLITHQPPWFLLQQDTELIYRNLKKIVREKLPIESLAYGDL